VRRFFIASTGSYLKSIEHYLFYFMLLIHDYISDFLSSEHFLFIPASLKEYAEQVLDYFCSNSRDPVSIPSIETTLFSMARLDLPLSVRKDIPKLLVAFFEYLGLSGKYPPAVAWIGHVELIEKGYRALFREDGSVRGTTFEKHYSDVGRNDPCPCGSGKKFKKCCG
jgi:hypothetical protein